MFDDVYLAKILQRTATEAKEAQASGAKVIGSYCAFTPKELISAAGAIPVSLCAGSQSSVPLAEQHLPRNLCALIKSSYGHGMGGTCPYFQETDLILADATCDGKKKMYELMQRIRPLHLLQLPQTADTDESRDYWRGEIVKIKKVIEEFCSCEITDAAMRAQIRQYNKMRRTVTAIYSLNCGPIPLLFGHELDIVTSTGGFECNLPARMEEMAQAIELARERGETAEYQARVAGRPRILVTGCPTTNMKVVDLIENSGGIVVSLENCGGQKTIGELVDEDAPPLEALADCYLRIACSCMSPNHRRLVLLEKLIKDYRIDGVIDMIWDGCHTYNVESFFVKEMVEEMEIPFLRLTTDYAEYDTGQLMTRIEGFLELMS